MQKQFTFFQIPTKQANYNKGRESTREQDIIALARKATNTLIDKFTSQTARN